MPRSSPRPHDRPLSELEGVVLGLLALGPATGYALRQFFLQSPSPYWSGSAGAIYPLALRLRTRDLLAAHDATHGRRPALTFSLTAAGRRALHAWLTRDIGDDIVGVPFDPLRSRMRFIEILPARERRSLIRTALSKARAHLRTIDEDCAAKRDDGGAAYHVARGAQLMMQARVQWLEELSGGTRGRDGATPPVVLPRPSSPRHRRVAG